MSKTKILKNAYNRIKNGEKLVCNGCVMWKYYDPFAGHNVIEWRNFGQSANRMNFDNFKWIVEVIAKSTDYIFETPQEYAQRKNIPLYLV